MSDSSQTATEFDVVVVGAGLIGATCAGLLARAGLRVALVEARARAACQRAAAGRVSALNLAARNIFSALEIWEEIPRARRSPYRRMEIWDAHTPARISFTAADIYQDCLGFIVENQAALNALWDKLAQNYQVTIFASTELADLAPADDGLTLTLRAARKGKRVGGAAAHTIQTHLLVGADGGNSAVKKNCDIKSTMQDLAQDAITATVAVARGHSSTARQCFLHTGPVAMLPLADKQCAVVWSCDREFGATMMALSPTEFAAKLQEIFGARLGDIGAPTDRRQFPLTAQQAERYIAPRVALVGDAAHTLHPLAGLGANLGLADAAALAEIVTDARARGLQIGQQSVLRRYERRRRFDNVVAQRLLTEMKNIFGSRAPTAQIARRLGINAVDAIAPLKHTLARWASGIHGDAPAVCK